MKKLYPFTAAIVSFIPANCSGFRRLLAALLVAGSLLLARARSSSQDEDPTWKPDQYFQVTYNEAHGYIQIVLRHAVGDPNGDWDNGGGQGRIEDGEPGGGGRSELLFTTDGLTWHHFTYLIK